MIASPSVTIRERTIPHVARGRGNSGNHESDPEAPTQMGGGGDRHTEPRAECAQSLARVLAWTGALFFNSASRALCAIDSAPMICTAAAARIAGR